MMLKKNRSCLEVGKDWFSLVLHTIGHHLPVATGCKKWWERGINETNAWISWIGWIDWIFGVMCN
jgi:hypothetical protein